MELIKPSVTELIGQLDKPALVKWANKIGLQGIELEQYRKESMQKGISLHKQIEDYHKQQIPFQDRSVQENYERFISDKQVIDCEKWIETDSYKGRLDMTLFYNGYKYICDFKSHHGVYLENKLQLTAYRMAEPNNMFTRIAVIEIPKFRLIIIDIWDFTPYEEIIKALIVIYNSKKLINEPIYK